MTVCTGTLALDSGGPVILMVADTKLSWGYDSVDSALKIRRVHEDWLFAFATKSTAASANLFEDLRRVLKGKTTLTGI
jgi:ATP-dependent protease HslVU (ClpYQ) peptidase subunit